MPENHLSLLKKFSLFLREIAILVQEIEPAMSPDSYFAGATISSKTEYPSSVIEINRPLSSKDA